MSKIDSEKNHEIQASAQSASEVYAPAEIVMAHSRKVACSGNEASGLGHPRVWLVVPPDTGFVECGYCDRRFVFDAEHVPDDH